MGWNQLEAGHQSMKSLANDRSFSRCFISGNDPELIARFTDMVRDRGLEAANQTAIRPGQSITNEFFRMVDEADFVLMVLGGGDRTAAAYEVGVAQGMGKPVFVVFTGAPSLHLFNAYSVALGEDRSAFALGEELDRFLRNAPARATEGPMLQRKDTPSLEWARKELLSLRDEQSADRHLRFEALCRKVLQATGATVEAVGGGAERGVDLIVWFNDIAFELSGPTLVECKFYGGRAGSSIKNTEATVRQLEALLDHTDSRLALLLYDHDRATPPPSLFETPRVLSFALESIIDAAERAELENVILKRRQRAMFARQGG